MVAGCAVRSFRGCVETPRIGPAYLPSERTERGEVVFDSASNYPRRRGDGFRSVDHLEASLFGDAERLSGADWIRLYVSLGKIGRHLTVVRACAVLAVVSASGGAAVEILARGGHW
jgi:hypothetical protein